MTKRKPKLNDDAAINGIKSAMGYEDGTRCCKVCDFFGECELSGAIDARPARCERNAVWFPVSESGHCEEFAPRNVRPVPSA